jgi:hypothetical protein
MLELRNEEDGSWPRAKSSASRSTQESVEGKRHEEDKETVKLGDGIVGMYNMG